MRRLCVLLDARLELASQPGNGSVFKASVPLAAVAPATRPADAPAGALRRGLVLVVDDETAIREAMSSLLASWGYHVLVAGSGDEIVAQLAACSERPALIISDYRLRGGENGIEVIERLRSECNDDIPALLVTGDTAPDRLREAQASGLLLLHKPVPNSRLRAAIVNLMNRAGSDG